MTGLVNPHPSTPPLELDTTTAYQHRVLELIFLLPATTAWSSSSSSSSSPP
jgi:hypothetical protein